MKILLAAALFAALSAGVASADILANGDFSSGSAHWQGDRVSNTDATDLVITLKHDTWTKVFQTFHSSDSALKMHVTYTLSDDCTFLPQNGMSTFFLTNGVVKDITGVHLSNIGSTPIPIGGFLGVIFDPTRPLVFTSIVGGKVSTDTQSTDGFFYDLNPHADKMFYLAFPPGQGTVALTGVALELAPNGPTK